MLKFSMILAMDAKNGIWRQNDLPWRIKKDMQYFKEITTQTRDENKINAVIMWRKTWESIPEKFRPLSDRMNCVLTRDREYEDNGCVSYTSLEECLEDTKNNILIENIFIIGGSQLYNWVLGDERLDKIYLTRVEWEYKCEVFFDWVPDKFLLESASEKYTQWEYSFVFEVYKRWE